MLIKYLLYCFTASHSGCFIQLFRHNPVVNEGFTGNHAFFYTFPGLRRHSTFSMTFCISENGPFFEYHGRILSSGIIKGHPKVYLFTKRNIFLTMRLWSTSEDFCFLISVFEFQKVLKIYQKVLIFTLGHILINEIAGFPSFFIVLWNWLTNFWYPFSQYTAASDLEII